MGRLILFVTQFYLVSIVSLSQSVPLTAYANFKLNDGNIIWQKIYEVSGASEDSIKSIIHDYVKFGIEFSIIHEYSDESELIVSMEQKIFEKNGDIFNGRINFEVKHGRYRVTLSEITRFFGVKTRNMAGAFGVSNNINNMNVGIRFEDDFINKAGVKLVGKRGLDVYNKLFSEEFMLKTKQSVVKEDW